MANKEIAQLKLTDLGPDALAHVLSHLPNPADLASASAACRVLRHAGRDPQLWQAYCMRKWHTHNLPAAAQDWAATYRSSNGLMGTELELHVAQMPQDSPTLLAAQHSHCAGSPPSAQQHILVAAAGAKCGTCLYHLSDMKATSCSSFFLPSTPPPSSSHMQHDDMSAISSLPHHGSRLHAVIGWESGRAQVVSYTCQQASDSDRLATAAGQPGYKQPQITTFPQHSSAPVTAIAWLPAAAASSKAAEGVVAVLHDRLRADADIPRSTLALYNLETVTFMGQVRLALAQVGLGGSFLAGIGLKSPLPPLTSNTRLLPVAHTQAHHHIPISWQMAS